tara:strand:- start:380 stop:898 length:519 start_codon:yes stop_codon:yes gene_type:complete
MKKNFFLIIFFFYFSFNSNIYANNNISFIDVEYIYANSIIGKKIKADLNSKLEKLNKEFLEYKELFEKEKNKINSQRNIISEAEFKKKTLELEKKIKNFNNDIAKKRKNYESFKKQTYNSFLEKLINVIKDYANDNSINLVLKKKDIIIGKNDFDISKNVLELLNNKIKSIN